MKKILKNVIFLSIVFLFMFFISCNVKAATINGVNIKDDLTNVFTPLDDRCGVFGNPKDSNDPAYWMQEVLSAMKYAGIVALLVLSIIDFLKATVEDDKEALKKTSSRTLKRFIYCVLLFFVPVIVKLVMELFGAYGTCSIG